MDPIAPAPTAPVPPNAAVDPLSAWAAYWVDRGQRTVLYLDALRRRGNDFLAHERGRSRPVLAFESVPVLDGRTLPRPANYALVRIVAPAGCLQRESGRPYLIIDPRAGNGSGIGGFKDASEVGCALHAGHPVYFATFGRDPVPGQTLADVCEAEAAFVREVRRRHPDAPKPVVVGNCQGGWATMLLAATHPDITGPIVANGAPLSYWAGRRGRHSMRYAGGLLGGVLPALVASDLGGGRFDGAHLVANFEAFNPSKAGWSKHYDAWSAIDTDAEAFLAFERWWSAFYLMDEAEIRWIVATLFVGNRLGDGSAMLDARTHVDLRRIQSPVVVFASRGDAITPPEQALGWITDLYATDDELRVRGQRIVYAIHDAVGHLGIFVSSEVAMKEHTEIVSTLKAIEALAPGLYEMMIVEAGGGGETPRWRVEFQPRTLDDLRALGDDRVDDAAFAAVARLSDLAAEVYALTWQPAVQAIGATPLSGWLRAVHPLRLQRHLLSDDNPWLAALPILADRVRGDRRPQGDATPFAAIERLASAGVTLGLDTWSAARDAAIEWTFHGVFGSSAMRRIGAPRAARVADAPMGDLRALDAVQDALDRIAEGGFAAALVRMLVLLARARGTVRRSRLEAANHVLEHEPPFDAMSPKHRTRLVHRESLIVAFAADDALAALPRMLSDPAERARALRLCLEVSGPVDTLDAPVHAMVERLAETLGVASPTAGAVSAAHAVPRRRKPPTPSRG